MKIPRYDEIQLPALKILSDGIETKATDLEKPLQEIFNLDDEDIKVMYKSGKGPVFLDRIKWALSYLNMAGLVSKPKRGYFKITEEGLKRINDKNFKSYVKNKMVNREPQKRNYNENSRLVKTNAVAEDQTPEESLYNSYENIKNAIYREIIDTINSKQPKEFEKLVVELLQKMGYGGEIEDSGIITPYTNDQGIDGIIKEDILGFGRINIQAKRYSIGNNISREDVQKFVGALMVAQSDKGVFITTSDFTKGAYEYVKNLNNAKIVLINGTKLSEYIYEYDLGMQTEKTLTIKRLDSDYWDLLKDDE